MYDGLHLVWLKTHFCVLYESVSTRFGPGGVSFWGHLSVSVGCRCVVSLWRIFAKIHDDEGVCCCLCGMCVVLVKS